MRVDAAPRFPADLSLLVRKLTSLFGDYGRWLNYLLTSKVAEDSVSTPSGSTALGDGDGTFTVTTTALTISLPAATAARIGREWTIILAVSGYVDIAVTGSDVIKVDGGKSSIRLDNYGATVTLRCLSASTWGLV